MSPRVPREVGRRSLRRCIRICLVAGALGLGGIAGLASALGQPSVPSAAPSAQPAASSSPSAQPVSSSAPSAQPAASSSPSAQPASSSSPSAQPAASSSPSAAPPSGEAFALARKKAGELNRSATKLFQKGEYAAGLAQFQSSYRLVPFYGSLTGAAGCLVKLQRYDEALDAFDTALSQYGAALPPKTKAEVLRQINAMRTVTGGVAVSGAEVGAMIVIDGRVRGEHPTARPVNVLVGPHLVRVYKEGFSVVEQSVDVVKGQITSLPVKLNPLVEAKTGRLKVESKDGKKMEVLVDGIPVGVTPWEGPVPAGEHTVVLRPLPPAEPPPPSTEEPSCNAPLPPAERVALAGTEETVASTPVAVIVKPQETSAVGIKVEPLDAQIRIQTEPATARVFLDGVAIGRGGFDSRAKPGDHAIKVEAEGYFSEERKATVAAGGQEIVTIKLRKDLDSPVWAEPGHYSIELGAGAVLAPTLGGDIASKCQGGCQQDVASGVRVALRGGYETPGGFGFGLTAGYLQLQQSTNGRAATLYQYNKDVPPGASTSEGVTGAANDTVTLRDVTLGAYAAYRFGKRFPVRVGASAGVALGGLSDVRTGIFGAAGVGPITQSGFVPWFFLEPEVRAGVRVTERFGLALSLSALILVTANAPQWNEEMRINAHGNELGNGGAGTLTVRQFQAEAVTGSTLFALTPGLSVRYDY